MEIKASAKYLRISPRKLRLLTKGLKGLSPKKAIEKLEFYPQRGGEFLIKLVKQARANAITNFKQIEENLKIKKIEVDKGPVFKRMDKSHGARFDRGTILKKTAHVFLTLETLKVKEKTVDKNLEEEKPSFAKATEGKHGAKS